MATDDDHYAYRPSLAVAVIAIVVFAIFFLVHLFRIVKTRNWFCIPIIVGAIFEIVGYVGRASGHYNMKALVPYILQALLILLAPILFAASVYMFLGRLVLFAGGESYVIIRVSWVTKIFVGGDIFCFLVQALGAGMLASADNRKEKDRGSNIILAGLVFQILIFGFFLLVALIFHQRLRHRPTSKFLNANFSFERFLYMIYGASTLITLRNLFRVIEYAMGDDGYLLSHEWPLYIFDALLMALFLGICYFWHVGDIISEPQQHNVELVNN